MDGLEAIGVVRQGIADDSRITPEAGVQDFDVVGVQRLLVALEGRRYLDDDVGLIDLHRSISFDWSLLRRASPETPITPRCGQPPHLRAPGRRQHGTARPR